MKTFIRKHYLTSFYFIALIFSVFLLGLHFVFKTIGEYSVSFTQFSPFLAVILISIFLKDKSILNDIKGRFTINRSSIKWILLAILIPGICVIVSSFIMTYNEIEFVVWNGNVLFYTINFIAITIGSVVEEVGWRGFLLPNLQKKYSPFVSSLIVGILWGVWHFNFMGGILGFVLYTITIIEMSILMTWLYNKSNGNLLIMTIWHLVFNLSSRIFLWERFSLQLFVVQSIVFGVLCFLFLVFDRKTFFSKSRIRDNIT